MKTGILKKLLCIMICIFLLLISAVGCGKKDKSEEITVPSGEDISDFDLAPAEYRKSIVNGGTLEHFTYQTKNYSSDNSSAKSYAYVYLPYGYDESDINTKYDILYLMHGAGGDETGYLGTGDKPTELKYILDNAILNKEMKPLIVVAATINNEGNNKDYNTGINNFRKELTRDLVPSIEAHYHTYAKSTGYEDLKQSRVHRAFGGFSMGGYIAMTTFLDDFDCFKYFMFMSSDYTYRDGNGDYEEAGNLFYDTVLKSGYSNNDYYIFGASGTKDFLCQGLYSQMKEIGKYTDAFKMSKNGFGSGNMLFYMVDGNKHGSEYSYDYIYNALKLFFQ